MKKFTLLLVLIGCTFKTNAQQLMAEWLFEPPLSPGTLVSNYSAPGLISASNFSSGPGLNIPGTGFAPGPGGGAVDRSVVRTGWNATTAFLADDYYQFSVDALGPVVTLTEISWWSQLVNGPNVWELRASFDGFASSFFTVGTGPVSGVFPAWDISTANTLIVFSGGQTVTFRLYGRDASDPVTGQLRLDSVRVRGFENSPLPITLVSFDGEVAGRDTRLRWQTASEVNNSHFTILRSGDLEQWEDAGTVPGAGHSQSLQDYVFYDMAPLAGTSYYRLRQTDFDGTFEEFPQVVAVTHRPVVGTHYQVGDMLELPSSSFIVDHLGRVVSPPGQAHRLHTAGTFIVRSEDGTTVRIVVSN